MSLLSPRSHPWLHFSALLLACSDDSAGAGPDTGQAASSSTGGAPDTPTQADPSSSGADPSPSSSTSQDDPGTGSTGFADPGPVCGDGVQGPKEGCDEGEANDDYGFCTHACQLNVCGDGKVLVGVEGCDEGAANSDTGYCRADCQLGVCGDGFVFAGLEQCDAGDRPSEAYGQCDASCTLNRCGDGHLDPGFEECDDGADNGVGGGRGRLAGCDLDCGFAGRRLFISSQTFDGDLGTRAGADLACQNLAKAAKYKHPDRFRALLADAEVGPADFVADDPGGRPFILPSGLILAADYPALIAGGPGDGVVMTETGETLHAAKVWTNLNVAGTAYLKDAASTCAGWSSADLTKTARVGLNAPPPGDAAALAEWKAGKQWLSYITKPCKNLHRLYCVEAT